jgi:hypothetical protein
VRYIARRVPRSGRSCRVVGKRSVVEAAMEFRATLEVVGAFWRLAEKNPRLRPLSSMHGHSVFVSSFSRRTGEGTNRHRVGSRRSVGASTVLSPLSLIGLRGKTTY